MTWYVVDGMDGSGKSTAAYELKDILETRGRTVLLIAHPNRNTKVGRLSAKFLTKEGKSAIIFATVFFGLSVIQSLFKIKRSKCDDFIFVRYTLSVSYLPVSIVIPAYKIITAMLPKPDVKIYKDVDVQDALKRIEKRGETLEVFENLDALINTREKMLMLTDDWYTINGRFTPDEVSDDLIKIINL